MSKQGQTIQVSGTGVSSEETGTVGSQSTPVSHTPGPWYVNTAHEDPQFQSVSDGNGRTLADIGFHKFIDTHYPLRPESEANARLIAAAPDLLEALQAAQQRLELIDGNDEPAIAVRHIIGNALAKAVSP